MTADTLLGQGLWERERVCFFVCHGVRVCNPLHQGFPNVLSSEPLRHKIHQMDKSIGTPDHYINKDLITKYIRH